MAAAYDTDFYTWTQEQAHALRKSRPENLDWENLAEEIESLGKNNQHAIVSRLRVLIGHLLKWRAQPERRSSSWIATIALQRSEVEDLLEENPSLRARLPLFYQKAWSGGRYVASKDMNCPLSALPTGPLWSVEQVLDENFWPES